MFLNLDRCIVDFPRHSPNHRFARKPKSLRHLPVGNDIAYSHRPIHCDFSSVFLRDSHQLRLVSATY